MRTRTFEVFTGSTKGLKFEVVDQEGNFINATNATANLYDADMTLISALELVNDSTGIFKTIIDTTALGLTAGKYVIEFSCVANGNTYKRRDYLYVADFI